LVAKKKLKESIREGKRARKDSIEFSKEDKTKEGSDEEKPKKEKPKKEKSEKEKPVKEKRAPREKKEHSQDIDITWPENTTHLYLDGNNMMYVLAPLRQLAIHRNVRKAELGLESMAKKFAELIDLEYCHLMFDDTDRSVKEPNFVVNSARPKHKTSDDALVEIAQEVKKGIYVTSDRGLITRLEACGVQIMGPKTWFRIVAEIVDGKGSQNLDDWAAKWVPIQN